MIDAIRIQSKKKQLAFIFMLGFLFITSGSVACEIVVGTYDLMTSGSSSKSNTNFYAGLNWDMEGGTTPALVLGVFKTKVKLDGDTTGGKLAFHVNLAGGIKPGKLKLSYLNGKENVQGEIGVGFDFLKSEPLLGLGINGPYTAIGIDGYLNPGFVPYFQLHSQGEFDKPEQKTKCVYLGDGNLSGTYFDPDCTQMILN
jgi:hypothetical protein